MPKRVMRVRRMGMHVTTRAVHVPNGSCAVAQAAPTKARMRSPNLIGVKHATRRRSVVPAAWIRTPDAALHPRAVRCRHRRLQPGGLARTGRRLSAGPDRHRGAAAPFARRRSGGMGVRYSMPACCIRCSACGPGIATPACRCAASPPVRSPCSHSACCCSPRRRCFLLQVPQDWPLLLGVLTVVPAIAWRHRHRRSAALAPQ